MSLRKATRNRVQFTNDESAIKTLWLMICNIEDKRARKRAKEGKRAAATSGRIVEGGRVANWKQAINQMAVAYPDRFAKVPITNHSPHTNNLTRSLRLKRCRRYPTLNVRDQVGKCPGGEPQRPPRCFKRRYSIKRF